VTPDSTSRCCQCTFGSNAASFGSLSCASGAGDDEGAGRSPVSDPEAARKKTTTYGRRSQSIHPARVGSPRRPYRETVPLEGAGRVSICLPPALMFAHVFDERVRIRVGPAAAVRGRRPARCI